MLPRKCDTVVCLMNSTNGTINSRIASPDVCRQPSCGRGNPPHRERRPCVALPLGRYRIDARELSVAIEIVALALQHDERDGDRAELDPEDPLMCPVVRVEAEQDDAGRQVQPEPPPHHREQALERCERYCPGDAKHPQVDD